ncbi:MAG TPA: XdhC/CoxI family protein [Blastocatellia bacterium]|nr:XdhC/CoxI family protein [Blastocatellia bacterium]
MKELKEILSAFGRVRDQEKSAVLATVVKTSGSTYRRAGARLLITEEGQMIGSVSGGCLERDVFRRARRVLQIREPLVVRYDSMSEDDIVWGFGLGCNGVVDLLLEPVPGGRERDQMDFLDGCLRLRQTGVLATVFSVVSLDGVEVGCRLMLREGIPAQSDIADSRLKEAILADAHRVLTGGDSQVKVYEMAGGCAEVFVERIDPPHPLVIFGAGHDAVPLVRLAKGMGWHVTVVDGRPGYATKARFPLADTLIAVRPDGIKERVPLDSRTATVVMNHNYLDDLEVLRFLLPSPARYIGVLGPKRRSERLLSDLHGDGVTVTADQSARVHAPAGIDIGADTPDEIALSILAEIKAVTTGRSGGMLRERQGSIHSSPVDGERVSLTEEQAMTVAVA